MTRKGVERKSVEAVGKIEENAPVEVSSCNTAHLYTKIGESPNWNPVEDKMTCNVEDIFNSARSELTSIEETWLSSDLINKAHRDPLVFEVNTNTVKHYTQPWDLRNNSSLVVEEITVSPDSVESPTTNHEAPSTIQESQMLCVIWRNPLCPKMLATDGHSRKFLQGRGYGGGQAARIGAIPIYQSSVIAAPRIVLDEMEKLIRTFLWQGGKTGGKRKYNLVAWEKVCKPKWEGGTGIKKIQLLSKSLCAKLFWRVQMCKTRDLIQKTVYWEVRDGSEAYFWEDSWNDRGPLIHSKSGKDLAKTFRSKGWTRIKDYWGEKTTGTRQWKSRNNWPEEISEQKKKGWQGPSRCPCCEEEEETLEHLMLKCRNWPQGDFQIEVINQAWELVPGFVYWNIWLIRNGKIFRDRWRNEEYDSSPLKVSNNYENRVVRIKHLEEIGVEANDGQRWWISLCRGKAKRDKHGVEKARMMVKRKQSWLAKELKRKEQHDEKKGTCFDKAREARENMRIEDGLRKI
eukprot:Gb_09763 [translate_table: standard]